MSFSAFVSRVVKRKPKKASATKATEILVVCTLIGHRFALVWTKFIQASDGEIVFILIFCFVLFLFSFQFGFLKITL